MKLELAVVYCCLYVLFLCVFFMCCLYAQHADGNRAYCFLIRLATVELYHGSTLR